jgi:hypothetical protein
MMVRKTLVSPYAQSEVAYEVLKAKEEMGEQCVPNL